MEMETPEVTIEPVSSAPAIPDGPTELPNEPAPADQNLNPPLTSKAKKAESDKEKVKPEPAYKYDPRNAIYARRSQVHADEQASSDEAFNEGRQTTALPRVDTPTLEEPAAPVTPVASGGEFVTIKVYGEERHVPKSEVDEAGGIAAYQKAAAAAEKVRVNDDRARLQAEGQRLAQLAENLRKGLDENGQPLSPKPPPQGVPAISKEALEATVKGLYSGDTEEATAALSALVSQIGGHQAPSSEVNPEIVRAVEAQVLERMTERETERMEAQDVAEANRIFREEFKDIANDPEMMIWAKGLAETVSADPKFQAKSRAEIAKEVGNRIRGKLGKPTSVLEERRQLKSTLTPSSSGSGRVPQVEPQQFPTNADYIQQLRRNSGSNSVPR